MFLGVLLALLFLTFITVWVAQFDFGSANMLIAMSIASVKASLVIGFFMHLKYEPNGLRIIALAPIIPAILLVVIIMMEY